MAYGTKRVAADSASALGNRIRDGQQVGRLLVQHEMDAPEVRIGNMPMEIFRLEVQSENFREQDREGSSNFPHGRFRDSRGHGECFREFELPSVVRRVDLDI
ncbi:hypothetical protein JQ605_37390 [Bradyrhizobium sp. AUGA SZCCT0042]|nr:hypothetical protein [Bradyrhizobium sp. AUGA SZCCT0042]